MRYCKVGDYSKVTTLEAKEMVNHHRKVSNNPVLPLVVINDGIGYALVCQDKDFQELDKELHYIYQLD